MTSGEIDIRPLAESGLLAVLGDAIDPATNARALALAAALEDAAIPGVTDVVPAYVAVLVAFDPELADGEAVAATLRAIAASLPDSPELPTRERVIPVVYGGAAGPDLADVAAHTGLSPEEVIARHAAGRYRVASMGFSPGWGYLLGLPPELVTPRRSTPRTRVPRGSVAIGGAQTGVYSLDTPGGWNIVGHTAVPMFDPEADDPFFLRPGDTVRFARVDPDEMRRIADAVARSHRPHPAPDPDARTLTVRSPGALVTVQDLGRPGYLRLGVTSGGALDRRALTLGNRLLGNEPGAAALECAMAGPTLRFDAPALVAVTGADLSPRLNGGWIPMWEPLPVRAGDVLSFASPAHPGHGFRCYVCVDGGIATEPAMGSRSTDLFGRIGGIDGQPLRAGETLPLGAPAPDPDRVLRLRVAGVPPRLQDRAPIRAVIGPQQDRFTDAGIETFLSATWTVSPRSDRMGLRLSGPRVEHSRGADTISEGIAAGAVQVPGDGQPIALLPARQTAGGYPKIATVIGADLDRLGQLGPGDTLRFAAVDVAEARAATLASRAALGPDAVREAPRAVVVRPGIRADAAGWDEAATERIAAAAREHGVTEVAVSAPGLTVRMALAARPTSFPSPRRERDGG